MAYIRVKRIKKKSGNVYEYAYLVENRWRKRISGGRKGARQKVIAFLGRNYKRNVVNETSFLEYLKNDDLNSYISSHGFKEIVCDLVRWELYKHDVLDVIVDFENFYVRNYKSNVCLQINEGFLCDYSLKKLVNFKFAVDEHAGISLAKAFVDAGIAIPRELFIKLFEKMN